MPGPRDPRRQDERAGPHGCEPPTPVRDGALGVGGLDPDRLSRECVLTHEPDGSDQGVLPGFCRQRADEPGHPWHTDEEQAVRSEDDPRREQHGERAGRDEQPHDLGGDPGRGAGVRVQGVHPGKREADPDQPGVDQAPCRGSHHSSCQAPPRAPPTGPVEPGQVDDDTSVAVEPPGREDHHHGDRRDQRRAAPPPAPACGPRESRGRQEPAQRGHVLQSHRAHAADSV